MKKDRISPVFLCGMIALTILALGFCFLWIYGTIITSNIVFSSDVLRLVFGVLTLVFLSATLFIWFFLLTKKQNKETAVSHISDVLHRSLAGETAARAELDKCFSLSGLAADINRLLERLEAADAMRFAFMSNVSHDIKTPMTVILGYVTNILNGAIPRSEEQKYLERIQREIKRLSELVGMYLEVSRVDSGDWQFSLASFDLTESLRNTLELFLDKFEAKNLSGDFDCPEHPVIVSGDREAIERVLYCLLDNAAKFSPEGGRVDISVCCSGNEAVFSVCNEGHGIPREDLPFIFDRSFKGDRSRGLEKDSFGLGLYLSKKILLAHAADLTAESMVDQYTRFTFLLPLNHQTRTERTYHNG